MKMRNTSDQTLNLCGYHAHTPLSVRPGEVFDFDLALLKKFDPADLKCLKAADAPAPAPAPLKPAPAPVPTDEELDQAKLEALLKEANALKVE